MLTINDQFARKFLRDLFDVAVASANPRKVLAAHLPEKPRGRCIVVGAGKASAAMAAALEQAWPDVMLSGVVVTRYGHAVPTHRIKIIEASHPVPDENSVVAATEILGAVQGLNADDMVIALISGGGSALMVSPLSGISLTDKQFINRALLKSGASIGEMNVVRKHLSGIKGGKLAVAAHPARIVTLVISDVPGDDPATIASGPTVKDETTSADALGILRRYKIDVRQNIIDCLGQLNTQLEIKSDVRLIASPKLALKAAANYATKRGVAPLILGDALEGEAHELGKIMAGIAVSAQSHAFPASAPCVLLSGGETTVTIVDGSSGRGGRNTEFLLSAAVQLRAAPGIWGLAGDTDGIDGTENAAGAIISPDTLSRTKLDARQHLNAHDSYSYFNAVDDLILTGPSLTNVNDFRAILVAPKT
jgi:glycerate 2-kinase